MDIPFVTTLSLGLEQPLLLRVVAIVMGVSMTTSTMLDSTVVDVGVSIRRLLLAEGTET